MTEAHDFSFHDHAGHFDNHIGLSIPGYRNLRSIAVEIAPRFVSKGTNVYDIGCSTGTHLRSIYEKIRDRRSDVHLHGLDIEPSFKMHWDALRDSNLNYSISDARRANIKRASLVLSMFTVQFLPPGDKLPLLKRVHDGLIDGGCLLIAEKVLAGTGRMQDALSFPYYDYKQGNGFTADEILSKERSLRGQMTLWTETEVERNLQRCGFTDIQCVWGHFPFFCWLALK